MVNLKIDVDAAVWNNLVIEPGMKLLFRPEFSVIVNEALQPAVWQELGIGNIFGGQQHDRLNGFVQLTDVELLSHVIFALKYCKGAVRRHSGSLRDPIPPGLVP